MAIIKLAARSTLYLVCGLCTAIATFATYFQTTTHFALGTSRGEIRTRYGQLGVEVSSDFRYPKERWMDSRYSQLAPGLALRVPTMSHAGGRFGWSVSLAIPATLLLGAWIAPLILSANAEHRKLKREASGRCVGCGDDLTEGDGDACPECGLEIVPPRRDEPVEQGP
ncbi:MAG: hypothetical protein AAFR38_09825 [Planctomycetota bacterium]